jgi:Tol biopolymer transport system component
LYEIAPDGTGLQRHTNNAVDDYYGVWSPDGSKIAFTTDRDGNDEVYVMNFDDTNPVNMTNNPGDDRRPDWRPDGQKIIYDANHFATDPGWGGDASNAEIMLMNSDGSGKQRLTTDTSPSFTDWGARWAPDGLTAAFGTGRTDGVDSDVWMIDIATLGLTPITTNAGSSAGPNYGP